MLSKAGSMEGLLVGIAALPSAQGAVDGLLVGVQHPGQTGLEVGHVEGGQEAEGPQGK